MPSLSSFRFRTTIFLWIVLIITLLIPAWFTRNIVSSDIVSEINEDLNRNLKLTSQLVQGHQGTKEELNNWLPSLVNSSSINVSLDWIDNSNAPDTQPNGIQTGGSKKEGRLWAKTTLARKTDRPAVIMTLSVPFSEVGNRLRPITLRMFWAFTLAFGVIGLVSALAIRRLAAPIQEMVHVAEALGQGNYKKRLREYSSKDFKVLANSMNTMAEYIEEHIDTITGQKRQLEAVLDGMREGVMVLDASGHIRQVNMALTEIIPDILLRIGKRPLEAIASPELQQACDAVINGQEASPQSLQVEMDKNAVYDVNIVSLQEGGIGLGAVLVFHDISKLTRLERIRRDFVANVSHELRTPLTSIKGYAETMHTALAEGTGKVEVLHGFLEIILRNANHMTKMVSDLLNLTRLEDENKSFEIERINAFEAVDQAIRECHPLLKAKNVKVISRIPEEKLVIHADLGRLTQVFRNLIENAATHGGSDGDVIVQYEIKDRTAIFSVLDEGPGIPKNEQKRIFERFYRVEKHRVKNHGGSSGLGLAISKHIVEKMGGTIWVTSPAVDDRGSKFSFSLSLVSVNKDSAVILPDEAISPLK